MTSCAPAASDSDAAFVRFWKLDDRLGKLCDRCASMTSPFMWEVEVMSSAEISLSASLMSPLLTELQSSKLQHKMEPHYVTTRDRVM